MSIIYPLVPLAEYWVPLNILDIRPDTYEISNYGNVRRIEDKFQIKHQILLNEYGAYRIVNLVTICGSKPKKYLVHRLVGLIFVPNPNNYPQINHINNNGMDECNTNLQWCTAEYNTRYQEEMKRFCLSNMENYEIYKMIDRGLSNTEIVLQYDNPIVDEQYVELIRESYIRNNPISEFDESNKRSNSSKYSNDFVRKICELFESGFTYYDYMKIAEILNIDVSSKKNKDCFYAYCSNIYKRKHHTHISSNYNW